MIGALRHAGGSTSPRVGQVPEEWSTTLISAVVALVVSLLVTNYQVAMEGHRRARMEVARLVGPLLGQAVSAETSQQGVDGGVVPLPTLPDLDVWSENSTFQQLARVVDGLPIWRRVAVGLLAGQLIGRSNWSAMRSWRFSDSDHSASAQFRAMFVRMRAEEKGHVFAASNDAPDGLWARYNDLSKDARRLKHLRRIRRRVAWLYSAGALPPRL